MSFLNLELALFSVVANATTLPIDKVLKRVEGLYEKRKRIEDWVDVGIEGQKKKSQDAWYQ